MPSVRYYNQTGPFWDFVANLEEQGSSHPWFANRGAANDNNTNNQNETENESGNEQGPNPWTEGWAGFPWGPVPHRGGRRGHHHGHHGPPPPPAPPAYEGEGPAGPAEENEKEPEAGPSEPREPGHERRGPHAHRGRCGGRGRGGWGGRGRGHFHPYARGGPMGGFGGLAQMFQDQLFGGEEGSKDKSEDFTPEVDVFDAAEAFTIHVSLPGAKKEDVGVNWDAEKSELAIAGVVHRPGDEEFLKTLAMDERKVGAFERKVRLGSRANPAQVDVDGITARMEDGVLRIDVPKLGDEGFVEVRKVAIE